MKVLFVTNMYPTPDFIYNGIHVKEQVEYLTQKFDIDYKLLFINGRQSNFNYIKSIFSFGKLIRNNKFDLVHIHFGLSGLFLLFYPFLKIPVVVTLHGSDTKSGKAFGLMLPITKMVVSRASKVIIMNDNMIKVFKNESEKLIKIPCGINISTFDIGRKNQGIIKIGFPGNKERPGKNFNLFKEIIDKLNNEGFKISIVEFHNLTRDAVVQNLSALDCLLMTSLYEGSPQVIKEAMANQVPIVSTNVGDVKLTLAGVSNCYVMDSFESEPFLKPIRNIISQRREDRISNGKARINELELDQDSIVTKIFKIYQAIIAAHEKKN